ncbi:phenylalanine--tRNA ligase subunit beta [Pseudomarimonas salicorniae]|uniref:Phenylalanine--tRNA ligase beta subunit n=1 Tax=Pseudomarimonas salicorniae TaxID=2933270 RepID=A0ABT0GE32_9GAMM|nr:phenylalanine--tRNA ligase subunit beta [Lysobacter sp. CAU 1642]MCK7592810.1 phenylalanine--tRNA ligase subunit beta [Lysobacter sp. CAU 1642]
MKFPESWLREHVEVDADTARLCSTLTAIGLEVEGSETVGGELPGVVVGEIIACEKHPEADRLKLCKVSVGGGEPLQIVCGAPNARLGLKAPLASVGAELPGGLKIKPAKLRGVESFGMLCSAKELDIDADASGLMELPADAPVGEALSKYLGLPDTSIEIKLTPNRADCFSVRGIAYDVAAALGSSVKPLLIEPQPTKIELMLPIELAAGADCPRYAGRLIRDVDASTPTPVWMAERLRRCGIRPISLLVDVTQYVMLEIGQPMHAFDADTLRGPVGVRKARDGETLKLLDEREVKLDEGFLLITDADRPVALAGVMGGWDTRVTESTRNVFLEAAHFAPEAIIGRARKLGMHTDASHRFERGVDPGLPRQAIEFATRLIIQIAGGKAGPLKIAERAQDLPQPQPVTLRRARLARVLGMQVDDAVVDALLRALGMEVESTSEGWRVTAPSRRFDIAIEEDLIEEVARIHGYDRIPMSSPTGAVPPGRHPEDRVPVAQLRQATAARDYAEAVNFAFVDAALLQRWGLPAEVVLANPLASDMGVMRPSLLPGLVEAVHRNRDRQQDRVRLFEIGRVFARGADAPVETERLAAVALGAARAEQWAADDRAVDFYDAKGDLEAISALSATTDLRFEPGQRAFLHPGRSAEVFRGDVHLGCVGHLHPRLLKALDLAQEVVVFELDVGPLAQRAVPQAAVLSRFPSVRRDLAMVVPEGTTWGALESVIRRTLGPQLKRVWVFDQYVGPGLEAGFKSLAMGLILQDDSRTLAEQDVEQMVQGAVSALETHCAARLRG